jgi:hypothetical protein
MFVLPEDLPLELTPFAFLVGTWEGTGVISYKPDGQEGPADEYEFHQKIEFGHDGHNVLTYVSTATLSGDDSRPLPSELGYWRLTRAVEESDFGPGLLPGTGEPSIKTREDLEKLRNREGGFDIQVSTCLLYTSDAADE